MTDPLPNRRLSDLSTRWSALGRAHDGPAAERAEAQRDLLARYGGAVARYLRGALRDADAADDLYQEFALHFLRGDFHHAAPESGRFRDYLKTALLRLVSRHSARRHGTPVSLEVEVTDPTPAAPVEADREFLRSWRGELLARAWQALERTEAETGRPVHSVLRLRVENPEAPSERLADLCSVRLGRSVTPVAFRQALCRARAAFADRLLEEVGRSLHGASPAALEQELADLDLLEYCRPALARLRGDSA